MKDELMKAELLFDIPLSDYSTLAKASKNFSTVQVIYNVYRTHKFARETWGKTLWVNLNAQELVEGIDNFLKDFKKLPKAIRVGPVGVEVEKKMKQFKSIVPLMVSLKNEAMRERHWKTLMDKTGVEFDMAPELFTLENMFSMNLQKYQSIAEDIVNNAMKELAIEKGVKDISEIWANINFVCHKHHKNNEDRGFILAPADEILTQLENDSLNLQSMAGSQFIGPFLATVQTWDKNLQMISDVIEQWFILQRKWLYLEGIFVGGDVRTQLPKEAKKFDDIDKAYRKVRKFRLAIDCNSNSKRGIRKALSPVIFIPSTFQPNSGSALELCSSVSSFGSADCFKRTGWRLI